MTFPDLRRQLFKAAQGKESWHQAGNLPARVLDFMWNAIDALFSDGLQLSVETGCGLSTILFDANSKHHLCFTLGDNDNSLSVVKHSELFRGANTSFVLGPSQSTLHDFKSTLIKLEINPESKIDFALIDGPHAFPFPELDYWHIYPYLNHWGILAIDDIHIPTIRRLYEFLRSDTMFDFYAIVENTAFFVRNESETFSPFGDGWDRQEYNRQRLRR